MNQEKIIHQDGESDAWLCVCGNEPWEDGFYPCSKDGIPCEGGPEWEGTYYICDRCGRIINEDTCYVIGKISTLALRRRMNKYWKDAFADSPDR